LQLRNDTSAERDALVVAHNSVIAEKDALIQTATKQYEDALAAQMSTAGDIAELTALRDRVVDYEAQLHEAHAWREKLSVA
jgi:hypothetical protein